MRLTEKQKQFLNNKCIEQFGITFESLYLTIEQNQKMKEDLKKKEKEIKKLKK